jgi:hypothetical protein
MALNGLLSESAEHCNSENNIARTKHSPVVDFIQMTILRLILRSRRLVYSCLAEPNAKKPPA